MTDTLDFGAYFLQWDGHEWQTIMRQQWLTREQIEEMFDSPDEDAKP